MGRRTVRHRDIRRKRRSEKEESIKKEKLGQRGEHPTRNGPESFLYCPRLWRSSAGFLNRNSLSQMATGLLRKKCDVLEHAGQPPLAMATLKNQLETKGPGWYSLSEREARLFTNRSNRPGDDMKDELRSDGDPYPSGSRPSVQTLVGR